MNQLNYGKLAWRLRLRQVTISWQRVDLPVYLILAIAAGQTDKHAAHRRAATLMGDSMLPQHRQLARGHTPGAQPCWPGGFPHRH